ncbi:hypothetical protein CXB51_004500 [Gossypium anomalum]|uniref:Uncharacterized protein n=1 Tax=Gossypium anomalum TaxID=47600 RepID=A0A8J5ZEZ3_9ROSI|nr:hypothetical protein CXB51_004500 [Gossypium anomalum]
MVHWAKTREDLQVFVQRAWAHSYGAEIMMLTGDCQLKRLTGVKSKDIMIWITIFDVFVDDTKVPRKIYFANLMGLSQSYLATTVEDEPKEMK